MSDIIEKLACHTNVNIYGNFGAGKSTLVRQLNYELSKRAHFYPDGVFIFDLSELHKQSHPSIKDLMAL